MKLRSTVVLLGVALALGLYVWLVEIRGAEHREEADKRAKRLLALDEEDVAALELPLEGGGKARLVRQGETWRVASPAEYPADEERVEQILKTLAGLSFEGVIEPTPEDRAPFGLGDGRREVRIELLEGGPHVLQLGGDAPVGALVYASLEGDPRVVTVQDSAQRALEVALSDLRDKRILQVAVDDVRALELRESGRLLVAAERAEKEPEGWRLTAPEPAPGDGETLRRLIQDVGLARASAFVDDPKKLSEYGLDPPELELRLALAAAERRLAIGRVQDRGYVRVDAAGPIFEVPDHLLLDVPRELFAYRFKRVLEVEAPSVKRIRLRFPRDDATYSFAREDDRWRPEDAVEVESLRVEDVLYALDGLEATGVVAEGTAPEALGLAPARVRVSVEGEDGAELAWLELGDPDPEKGIAARSSQGPTLWRVARETGDEIPLGLDAFRNDFVKRAEEKPAPAPPEPAPPEPAPAEPSPEEPPPAQEPPAEEGS